MPSITLSDTTLTYSDEGSGPVVVLVHGAFVDRRLWREVIPRLTGSFRVVALDLPLGAHRTAVAEGVDLTPPGQAARVAEALEALDLRDVCLVGNDTGGGVCQLVAAHHPARIGRLVLTNADAYEAFPPMALRPLAILARRAPRVVDAMLSTLDRSASRWALVWPVWKAFDRDLAQDWLSPIASDAGVRADAVQIIAGMQQGHHRAALPALRAAAPPTLMAWAPGDRLFPARVARRLAAELPGASVTWLARGRSFTPLEQPEALAGAIAGFAAGVAPATERAVA